MSFPKYAISYPMSSGSLASGWSPIWGTGTGIFAKHNPVVKMQVKGRTVNKTANPKIFFPDFSRVSPGDQPLAKEPEDCVNTGDQRRIRVSRALGTSLVKP